MRRRRRKMGPRGKAFLRVFLGVVLLFVASWLVFVETVVANRAATEKRATLTSSSNEMLKHWKWSGRERNGFHLDTNHLIYVSKRRVPNGPDPIHNRRAVKTREPPSA